jgi:hypothetical protein
VAPVEHHEADVVFSGGRGDQGIREAGALARSEISPVEGAEPRRFLGNGQNVKSQENLLQGPLFLVTFDASEQLGDRSDRDKQLGLKVLEVLYRRGRPPRYSVNTLVSKSSRSAICSLTVVRVPRCVRLARAEAPRSRAGRYTPSISPARTEGAPHAHPAGGG